MPDNAKFTVGELSTILQGYGISGTGFAPLITAAVRNNWTPEELIAQIYASPEFAQMFPGIVDQQTGAFIMQPAEYLSTRQSWQRQAQIYGFNFTNEEFGTAVNQGVSTQEFTDRLEAAARFDENPQFAKAWAHYTGQSGKKDIFDAILGVAPKEFYDVYEKASVKTAAALEGVHLGDKLVEQITSRSATPLTEADIAEKAGQLARDLRTLAPLSKLVGFGLNKSDLVQLEFGGPRQAKVFEKAERVKAELDRSQEKRAHAQLYPDQTGQITTTGGYKERAQA